MTARWIGLPPTWIIPAAVAEFFDAPGRVIRLPSHREAAIAYVPPVIPRPKAVW